MGNKAARTAMAGSYGKQAQSEGAGMSDDKVVPMKKREDRYEALVGARAEFQENVYGAIHAAWNSGVDRELMRDQMLCILHRIMADLDFDQVKFEPEEPA
ncbi:hypothetical protein ISD85_03305 [Pseudomonas aeruginosa]|nr:hypothetical protein [Pseudomonas aeruginosa]MBI8300312.1 hypothetical protein [Pseudomonas aeruginosa]MBX5769603.1 hypothetical protein [Pseudomonas aeruginosa]MCS8330351.1 hypothetical protein [Pseudomonas aeruginosa]MCS8784212.1 hypothetical protein [Pseudomonas aeruginosa]MDJ1307053.1 hypothetical protein [Pseudomonas aeruginosa]